MSGPPHGPPPPRPSSQQLPEGLSLLLAAFVLCREGARADAAASNGQAAAPAALTCEDALSRFCAAGGLTTEALTTAFARARALLPHGGALTTVICRLPETLCRMPAHLRRVWKGALELEGATHLAFVTGDLPDVLRASNHVLAGGHLHPLDHARATQLQSAAANLSPGTARGFAFRLLDAGAARAKRREVESRLVAVGLAGIADEAKARGAREVFWEEKAAAGRPGRLRLKCTDVGISATEGRVVAVTAGGAYSYM